MSTLSMWTVYSNPADYPGKFVVRRFEVNGSRIFRHNALLVIADSLSEARNSIPDLQNKICIPRQPDDEVQVVEVWM